MTEGPGGLLQALVIVPVGLLGILWASSRLSGWSRLAARYGWDGEVTGPQWRWVSIGFGALLWYNHCLTVTATARGLALRMQPLMRLFHPPLLIPWDRIAEARPWGGMLMRGVALRCEGGSPMVIFKQREYGLMQSAFPERLRVL